MPTHAQTGEATLHRRSQAQDALAVDAVDVAAADGQDPLGGEGRVDRAVGSPHERRLERFARQLADTPVGGQGALQPPVELDERLVRGAAFGERHDQQVGRRRPTVDW